MYEYKFNVRVGSKIINCRAFTLKEYLELITAKNNGSVEVIVKKLIKDCTNAKDLTAKHQNHCLFIYGHILLVKLITKTPGSAPVELKYQPI